MTLWLRRPGPPSEPPASAPVDAGDGAGGDEPEAQSLAAEPGAAGRSVFVAWAGGHPSQPGLGDGHHLYPDARRQHLPLPIIDWHTRYVLAWELSNTLDASFCVRTVPRAIAQQGVPEIFNPDQGCQFTPAEFIQPLLAAGIKLPMDGKGRCLDNVFVGRLWRTVRYEEVCLKSYCSLVAAHAQLDRYFQFSNERRPHRAHDGGTPGEAYRAIVPAAINQ